MTAGFEALCTEFCALAAIAPPQLQVDAQGVTALNIVYDEVQVAIAHHAALGDAIVVVATLGQPPAAREQAAMRSLLDANFLMLGYNAPAFSRNPDTGDFLVQFAGLLAEFDAQALCSSVVRLAALARRWRDGQFEEPGGS